MPIPLSPDKASISKCRMQAEGYSAAQFENRSMIPHDCTFRAYYRDYNEIRHAAEIPGHGLRYQWAQERFASIAGSPCRRRQSRTRPRRRPPRHYRHPHRSPGLNGRCCGTMHDRPLDLRGGPLRRTSPGSRNAGADVGAFSIRAIRPFQGRRLSPALAGTDVRSVSRRESCLGCSGIRASGSRSG